MTTQSPLQQAIFPDLPRNQKFLNQDGTINQYWMLWFANLVMALQTNLTPEGFVIPKQTASDIATFLTGDQSIANIVYDSTNNVFKGNVNGSWKTFTLTP